MRYVVQFWRSVLFIFRLRDYKFAWEIRYHAFNYLNEEFWCESRRARGFLLPAQREALDILSGGFENHELVNFEEV